MNGMRGSTPLPLLFLAAFLAAATVLAPIRARSESGGFRPSAASIAHPAP